MKNFALYLLLALLPAAGLSAMNKEAEKAKALSAAQVAALSFEQVGRILDNDAALRQANRPSEYSEETLGLLGEALEDFARAKAAAREANADQNAAARARQPRLNQFAEADYESLQAERARTEILEAKIRQAELQAKLDELTGKSKAPSKKSSNRLLLVDMDPVEDEVQKTAEELKAEAEEKKALEAEEAKAAKEAKEKKDKADAERAKLEAKAKAAEIKAAAAAWKQYTDRKKAELKEEIEAIKAITDKELAESVAKIAAKASKDELAELEKAFKEKTEELNKELKYVQESSAKRATEITNEIKKTEAEYQKVSAERNFWWAKINEEIALKVASFKKSWF